MSGVLRIRVALLATALVAVAVVCVVAEWGAITIIAVMTAAFLAVSLIEIAASRFERRAEEPEPGPESPALPTEEPSTHVRVLEPQPQAAGSHEVAEPSKPEPEPEPEPALQVADNHKVIERESSVPEPPAPEPALPQPPAEPEPVRPPLLAVPSPRLRRAQRTRDPEPPAEPEAAPAAAATVVSLAARDERPREWNLWELERATRDVAGSDPLRDEERSYLLMYLREFANPNGSLPPDFDTLVRDSFHDVIAELRS